MIALRGPQCRPCTFPCAAPKTVRRMSETFKGSGSPSHVFEGMNCIRGSYLKHIHSLYIIIFFLNQFTSHISPQTILRDKGQSSSVVQGGGSSPLSTSILYTRIVAERSLDHFIANVPETNTMTGIISLLQVSAWVN